MILPLAYDTITLKKIKEKKVYYEKRKKRKVDGIKFGMTSTLLRHALLGVTL